MKTIRMRGQIAVIILASVLLCPSLIRAQTFNAKEVDARMTEYRKWLDQLGDHGLHYWTRLDSTHRPHRLYLGDGFMRASATEKEEFVEIFSRFLAGYPDKNMLIDLYDASNGKRIGEYGFGGYRLFDPKP